MDEPVLVDSDIDEGSKSRDIGHNAFQFHAGFQVADFMGRFRKLDGFKFAARVTTRTGQLLQNIANGEFSGFTCQEVCSVELLGQVFVAHQ